MGKCNVCGKHGLFLKTNHDGLCKACQLAAYQKQVADLQEKIDQLKSRRENEEALLAQAISRAEKQAAEKTEPLFRRAEEIKEHIASLNQSYEKLQGDENKLSARVAKMSNLLLSAKYALSEFKDGYNPQAMEQLIHNMEELVPPAQDLNCLTMKDLRAQYRAVEKQIKSLYTEYQARYTTKAYAMLYKLMVLALSAELDVIMKSLSFNKLDAAISKVKKITSEYYAIIADGNQTIAPTLMKFTGQIEYLYINAVKLEYEYFVRRERAKEEQRAIREQMRQEAAERKLLEQQRKKVESEEKKYLAEIERLKAQLAQASEAQSQLITNQLSEVREHLSELEGKREEIINLQNGKAGTVYVISNMGAFGDHVFKIGMTRRLEPEDRVNELGNASVPFPYDIHSLIFSQDAVSLEHELHTRLDAKRVNKVNRRKEFFDVSLDELEALVSSIDPTAPFNRTMVAEQYRLSLSLDHPLSSIEDSLDIDPEEEADIT